MENEGETKEAEPAAEKTEAQPDQPAADGPQEEPQPESQQQPPEAESAEPPGPQDTAETVEPAEQPEAGVTEDLAEEGAPQEDAQPSPEQDVGAEEGVEAPSVGVNEEEDEVEGEEDQGEDQGQEDLDFLDVPRFSVEDETKALGSIISLRKAGVEGGYYDRRVARFANTYKLSADNPFHVEKVEKLLDEVLAEAMENLSYDSDMCPKQAKWACSMIRAKVKEMEFDRYKIITIVTIGEKRAQDILYTIRFLWDEERDKFAMSTHENMHVFGVAMCLGIYYE